MRLSEITSNVRTAAMLAFAGLLGLAGSATRATAQCGNPADVVQNCLPQDNPGADRHEDFSRVVTGEAFVGPETAVRIRHCGGNARTRYVANLPIALNLCQERACDELTLPAPCGVPRGYILNGLYTSATRLDDPCANIDAAGLVLRNTRVGVFSARGDVLSCAGTKVGTWTLEGTVGTNTSTPPLPEGCGECYVCDHHTGLLKIVGLKDSGKFCPASNIVAFVQFDTNKTSCPVPGPSCDDLDPCEVGFIVRDGTADGVYRRPCCQIVVGGGNGNGHGNPNAAIGPDDDFGDIQVIGMPKE